jgi:dolichyl-phosphooligosaccharide-protein glycotransferase
MSQRREQAAERLPASETVLDWIENWYHVPVLAALVAFMAWIRVRDWETFLVDGRVLFSGNDAWYHFRQVNFVVRNWPQTMPFDPWTRFPMGTSVGQFGTLFDQLIATVALVIGLGDPSQRLISLTLLFAPAAFGVLTAIPVYFIGKRLGGRLGGVTAVAILALTPGDFLRRSLVGFSDHQIAEAFFQALSVAVVLIAIAVARREKPVYELFVDRDWAGLRRPVAWCALAGVAVGLYIWVWPPAILLVGILGVYFAISLTAEYIAGDSPDHVAIAGAISLGVAGVLALVPLTTASFSPTDFSLLQPLLAFAVAVGCAFMAWLARFWDAREYSRYGYPAAIVGGIALVAGLVFVLAPDLATLIRSQFLRVAGFGTTATAQTVGEAQPIPVGQATGIFTYFFGLTYLTAVLALAVMGWQLLRGAGDRRAIYLFVIVWTVFLLAATLTQQRFNYYLLLAIAALNAFLIGWVIRFVAPKVEGRTDTNGRLSDLKPYQVLAVIAVVLVVTAPLVVRGQYPTAAGYADDNTSPGEVAGWEGSLEWLQTNTPEEGTYGGADNEMGYYSTYDRVEDFNYPPGAYGVISWWDYGHFITSIGERIPTANPFQQGATNAANFLLATNESRANELLPDDQGGQTTRYVMLDWKLAEPGSGKFTAPMVFYDDGPLNESDVVTRLVDPQNPDLNSPVYQLREQRFYESMRVRLYQFHGSAATPEPIVVDYDRPGTASSSSLGEIAYGFTPTGENASAIQRFDTLSAARAFVAEDGSAQVGGIQGIPSEYVPALEHYRQVHAANQTASTGDPWVETFERVPGATVSGTGPANTVVTASVDMTVPGRESFTYTQRARTDAQGRFSMTVPYSTTGYEQWGTAEGYTDVSIRAEGPYSFTAGENANATVGGSETAGVGTSGLIGGNASNETNVSAEWNASAAVPEGAVIGERNGTIQVTLERTGATASENRTATNGSAPTANATGGPAALSAPSTATRSTGQASGSPATPVSDISGADPPPLSPARTAADAGRTVTGR